MSNKWLCNSISELDDFNLVSRDDYYIKYTDSYNLCFDLNNTVSTLCSDGEALIQRMICLNDVIKSDEFEANLDSSTNELGTFLEFYKSNIISLITSVADRLNTVSMSDDWFATTARFYVKQIYESILCYPSDGIGDFLGTFANFGVGLAEGALSVGESIIDGFATIGGGILSIFTSIYDGITGDNTTDELWNSINSFVKPDHVGDAFDYLYDNTAAGDWLKQNCLFDYSKVRSVGKITGKVLTSVALAKGISLNPTIASSFGSNAFSFSMATTNYVTSLGSNYQTDLNTTNLNRPYHAISEAGIDAVKGLIAGKALSETSGIFNLELNSGKAITKEVVIETAKSFGVQAAKDVVVSGTTATASTIAKSINDTANGLGTFSDNFQKRLVPEIISSGTSAFVSNKVIGGDEISTEITNGFTEDEVNDLLDGDE